MAYISFKPTDYFNPRIYTGNGSTQTISGVGFQPDMTWIKDRSDTEYHRLYDSLRGATKEIYPNASLAEGTNANSLTSWNADGFAVGTETGVNTNTDLFVSWNWKAGTTSGLSGGTITPDSYSINTTAKQGIYKYSGTGSAGTIAHGLGAVPKMIIVRNLQGGYNWIVYHESNGATKYMYLDTDAAPATGSTYFSDTAPTSTVFSIGTDAQVNTSGADIMAYAFCDVKGYCKIGSFKGNATADLKGPFVYTGFRPAFIMIKILVGTASWYIYDNKRQGYNGDEGAQPYLQSNATSADDTNAGNFALDIYSTGFKVRGSNTGVSGNNDELSYIAFAEFPMVSSTGQAAPGALF